MRISVIIPVYNGEKYLVEAVESVIAQPYKNIDIVIVDDGSTDGTPMLSDKLSEQYEQVYCIHKSNGGVSSARNVGIEYILNNSTEKEFIAFLDADDKWAGNAVTPELITINNDYDLIVFGAVKANDTLTRFSKPITFKEAAISDGSKHIWDYNVPFAAKMYSSELLRTYFVRFDEKTKYAEDQIFQLQCIYLSNNIHTVSVLLYIYRNSENSAMGRMKKMSPIKYFSPIIDGWLHSDEFINAISFANKEKCSAGNILAAIYILEMIEFTCRRSVTKGLALFKKIKQSDKYVILTNMREQDISKKQYSEKVLLEQHNLFFAIKHRFLGISIQFLNILYHIPFFRMQYQSKKYPFKNIPKNT